MEINEIFVVVDGWLHCAFNFFKWLQKDDCIVHCSVQGWDMQLVKCTYQIAKKCVQMLAWEEMLKIKCTNELTMKRES